MYPSSLGPLTISYRIYVMISVLQTVRIGRIGRISLGLFIASLCFFAHASASYAATYYVDSVSGSDSNAGTSTGTPWQTVAKVNSSTFSPGDSVLFMAGDLWRERLSFPSSGTSGNPITIGKYGTGTNPIFSGADVLPNANFTVYDASSSTYQIGGTVEGNGVAAMWENGVELKLATSLAAATSTPGSMYYNIATHVFYLHSAQANPNPITNGLVYEATKRGNVAIDNTNSWLIWQDLEIDKGFTNLSAHLITGANNIVRRVNYYDNANHSLSFYGSNNLGEVQACKHTAAPTTTSSRIPNSTHQPLLQARSARSALVLMRAPRLSRDVTTSTESGRSRSRRIQAQASIQNSQIM